MRSSSNGSIPAPCCGAPYFHWPQCLLTALAGRWELEKMGWEQRIVKINRLFVLLLLAPVAGVFPAHLPGRGWRRQGCSHSQDPPWAVVTGTGWPGDSTELSHSVTHGHSGCIHLQETLPSTHPSTTLPSTRVSKSTYIFQEEDIESQALQTGLKDCNKSTSAFSCKDTSDTWELPAPREGYWKIAKTELGGGMHLAFQVWQTHRRHPITPQPFRKRILIL